MRRRQLIQAATANVLPEPGPALTRVNGLLAPFVSRSSSRLRRTNTGRNSRGL